MLPIRPIEAALAAFRDEMRPYPGRAARSARMAIVVVLVTVASMALETPETAVSCYLVFFAAKEDAASTVLQSLKLIFGALFGIALGLVFLMVSADEPVLRLALMALFSFAGMFFAHASKLGPIAATVGFVLALAVTLYDIVPVPELLTRGLVWMWAIVAMPMAILLAVDAVAGTRADAQIRERLAERLDAIAALLATPTTDARRRVEALLAEGDEAARERVRAGRILSAIDGEEQARLGDLLELSYRLGAVVTSRIDAAADAVTAARVAAAARAIAVDDHGFVAAPGRDADGPNDEPPGLAEAAVAAVVARLEARIAGPASAEASVPPPKVPFLAEDAFTDPIHVRFALKTTLAALVCYVFYTATDWFGIHTALVTCYFVALSSLGETVHKLMLRIVGALIGAGLGVASIVFLMPHMDDIGHLALLVGVVSFFAAWISNGSARVSYMG
jgi:multidrug resistance protein MdtO